MARFQTVAVGPLVDGLPAGKQALADRSAVISTRKERAERSREEAAEDRVLITRFNGGDEAAFTEIVGRYRLRMNTLASHFLRNHADAEEVAQDTFIRAHRGLIHFRGDASLATWLHHIASNLARNRYWYFFRRRRHLTLSLDCPLNSDSDATFADLVPSNESHAAGRVGQDEFVALIATCMQQLDAGHREILTLRNDLHRSYGEIARALDINEGTVKSRIARARGKLRDLMVEACPEFAADTSPREWFEPQRSSTSAGFLA